MIEAFARLDRDDLVLGPTEDGGYYLIGIRGPADSASVSPREALAHATFLHVVTCQRDVAQGRPPQDVDRAYGSGLTSPLPSS
jgi:glycosyltransferase A (GT-A) superfamily protein (DUF2064 family)